MTVPGNEAELLTRVVSGDRAAFDVIMRLHEDRVFSLCLRILRDREGALDGRQVDVAGRDALLATSRRRLAVKYGPQAKIGYCYGTQSAGDAFLVDAGGPLDPLLAKADELGREAKAKGMALIVASENDGAVRLYGRTGFAPSHRRPITGFPGYKRGGDWMLMIKPCA